MAMMCRLLFLFLLLPAANVFSEDSATPAPEALVRQMVDEVLASIRQDKEITHNMVKMDEFVDARILPQFDFPRMARLTIGRKYWTDATPQEQQQLVDEFRTFLAHTFSDVIAQYTNQTITFTPLHMQPEEKDITVKTWVIDPNDEPTKLDYQMEKTASGWMIYDVNIDSMSLIKIYQSNFSDKLLHGGVPNLVRTLHKKDQEVEAANARKEAAKSKPEISVPAASTVKESVLSATAPTLTQSVAPVAAEQGSSAPDFNTRVAHGPVAELSLPATVDARPPVAAPAPIAPAAPEDRLAPPEELKTLNAEPEKNTEGVKRRNLDIPVNDSTVHQIKHRHSDLRNCLGLQSNEAIAKCANESR